MMSDENELGTRGSVASTAQEIIRRFEELNQARDRALNEGRQVIRLSANSIRAVHRGEFEEAARLMAEAETMLGEVVQHLAAYPSIYWAGYVQDAMKEFAEARVTYALVHGDPIPAPGDLGVEDAPYLNALAEAASELRREALDRLRADDQPEAIRLLEQMDDVYDLLVTIDFPDAITGGLRRTTDQLRAVLERTRGDVTVTMSQKRLEQALNETEERVAQLNQGDSSRSRSDGSI
jgi:translin